MIGGLISTGLDIWGADKSKRAYGSAYNDINHMAALSRDAQLHQARVGQQHAKNLFGNYANRSRKRYSTAGPNAVMNRGYNATQDALRHGYGQAQGEIRGGLAGSTAALADGYARSDATLSRGLASSDRALLGQYGAADRALIDRFADADAALVGQTDRGIGLRNAGALSAEGALRSGFAEDRAINDQFGAANDAYLYNLGIGDRPADYAGFQAAPGYEFAMNEGVRARDAGAAARGSMLSGAAQRELTQFGQGLANQEFGNHMARLGSMAGRYDANIGSREGGALAGLRANTAAANAADVNALGRAQAAQHAALGGALAGNRTALGQMQGANRMNVHAAIAGNRAALGSGIAGLTTDAHGALAGAHTGLANDIAGVRLAHTNDMIDAEYWAREGNQMVDNARLQYIDPRLQTSQEAAALGNYYDTRIASRGGLADAKAGHAGALSSSIGNTLRGWEDMAMRAGLMYASGGLGRAGNSGMY